MSCSSRSTAPSVRPSHGSGISWTRVRANVWLPSRALRSRSQSLSSRLLFRLFRNADQSCRRGPFASPSLAVLYTDATNGERARQLFENVMRQRLERLGAAPSFMLSSVEDEGAVARSLQHLLRAKPTAVLIASTTAPAGPEDALGRPWRAPVAKYSASERPSSQALCLAELQRRCAGDVGAWLLLLR